MVRSELGVSLQSATTELQSVEAALDAVLYNGTTNATALADQINAVTPNISTTPFQLSTLTALANAQVTGSLVLHQDCPSLVSGQCKPPRSLESDAWLPQESHTLGVRALRMYDVLVGSRRCSLL